MRKRNESTPIMYPAEMTLVRWFDINVQSDRKELGPWTIYEGELFFSLLGLNKNQNNRGRLRAIVKDANGAQFWNKQPIMLTFNGQIDLTKPIHLRTFIMQPVREGMDELDDDER